MEQLEVRQLLSAVTWVGPISGSWNTGSNWSGGAVPTASSDVVIGPGTIQVTLNGSAAVNSLTITGDALQISAGTLAIGSTLSNSGSITVNPGAQLSVGGAYSEGAGASLTLPSGVVGTGVGTNLLANSNFESPSAGSSTTTSPGNWNTWNSTYLSNQYAHGGVQSVQTSGPNSGLQQVFAATPGVSYTGSVYAMTPSTAKLTGPEGAFLIVLFYTASGMQIEGYSAPNDIEILNSTSPAGGPVSGSVGGQGWNFYTTTAVAPSNAATVAFTLDTGAYTGNSGTAGGSVYYDDPQFGPTANSAAKVTAASIASSGTISIGAGDNITAAGAFTQTASGVLDVLLGGPAAGGQFGSLGAGTASLGGTLQATLVNGYSPTVNDGFSVLNYFGQTGSFSAYQLPSGSSYAFQPSVNPTYVGIGAVPPALTTTVNVGTIIDAASTGLVGVNLAFWDDSLNTAQTEQMVKAAGLTTFRFPGGSSSDDYHFNVSANYGDPVANTIPEFAQFISAVNGVGVVTLDYGSGSPQEAEAELAYLSGSPTDTTVIGNGIEWNDSTNQWQTVNWQTVGYWASLRAAAPLARDDGLNFLRITHAAPFSNIKFWEVGNEEYGTWEVDHHGTALPNGNTTGAQHDPATYAQFAATFSAFVAADQANLPAISIGIDSEDPTGAADNNWTKNVLSDGLSLGFVPGFISDHSYMQAPGAESDSFLLNDTVSDPASLFDWSTRDADYRSLLTSTLGTKAASVQVMATEFNSVYSNPGKQTTSLVNGLFIADSLGSLLDSGYSGGLVWDLRNSWDTTENNSSTLYGWRQGGDYGLLGDPNISDPPSTGPYVPYPSYFAEQLASKLIQSGGEAVSAISNYSEVASYAVMEANGHLELLVINKNPDANLTEQFNLTGFTPSGQAQFWQYGEAQDYAQSQSTTGASSLANFTAALSVSNGQFSYDFPAYSMTVIDLAPAVAPTITHFVVNDDNPQRSMVDSLTVAFSEAVMLDAGAITLTQTPLGGGAPVSQAFTLSNPSNDQETYILTFTAPADVGNSLPDGQYTLTVHASVVHGGGTTLSGGDQSFSFYRLYGDYFGSGSVGFQDLVLLAQDFGITSSSPNYLYYMDVDADETIGFSDLVALAQRFGATENVAASASIASTAAHTPAAININADSGSPPPVFSSRPIAWGLLQTDENFLTTEELLLF